MPATPKLGIILPEGEGDLDGRTPRWSDYVAMARLTEEALCLWAIERVPYYAVPRFIEFRDDLPKNPQNKILKYQLRDEGKTARTWDIESSGITVTKR